MNGQIEMMTVQGARELCEGQLCTRQLHVDSPKGKVHGEPYSLLTTDSKRICVETETILRDIKPTNLYLHK